MIKYTYTLKVKGSSYSGSFEIENNGDEYAKLKTILGEKTFKFGKWELSKSPAGVVPPPLGKND